MHKWFEKNKIVKLVSVTVLIAILLYFGGLFIVFAEINKVENLYNNTESEFSKGKKFLVVKAIAEQNYDLISDLRSFFIQKGDEVKFIEEIEKVARTSGIKFDISSIEIKKDETDSFKENVEVKMKIEGSWKNIMFFANKMEKMPFGVLIKNLSLDADDSVGWSGSLDFIIFREK